MAADLGTLRVNIDGGSAVSSAQQITAALKEMGAAGDTAARSVQDLQTAASKPIGSGNQSSAAMTAQLVAGFERARQVMQEMQDQAKGMSAVGLGAEFAGVAAGASEVSAALTEALGVFKDMVAEGANVEDVLAAMKEQAMGLPQGFERLSAMEKMTFQQMQADIEGSITKYKAFQDAQKSVAATSVQAGKEFSDQEKQKQRATEQETAALKQQEQQLRRNQAVHLNAMNDMQRSPLGGAVSTMTNIGMGVSMMGQGVMGSIMGIQQLGMGLSEAAGGAGAFGAGFLALVPILAAVAAAIAAVVAAYKLLSEAFSAGMAQDKLTIQMTAMLGSTQAARAELEQIKDFVSSGSAGFLSFTDAQQGVVRLQALTGGLMSVAQAEQILAGAQAASGQSTDQLANEIGKVSNYMLAGNPLRYMMLAGLVEQRVITAQNAVELENMSKKGASGTAVFAAFEEALHRNDSAAKAASGTFGGLLQQLENLAQTRVFDPIGESLTKGLAPGIHMLDTMMDSPAIKSGIESFAYGLQVQLLTVFLLIKEKGLVGAFLAGVDEVGSYMQTHWLSILQGVAMGMFDFFRKPAQEFIDWFAQKWKSIQGPTAGGGLAEAGRTGGQGGLGETPVGQAPGGLMGLFSWVGQYMAAADKQTVGSNLLGTRLQESQTAQQQNTTSLNTLGSTNLVLNASVLKLAQTQAMYTLGAGGTGAGGAMFPGASRGLSEWQPGERLTHDTMFGPGERQMQMGDVALSPDIFTSLFGSVKNGLDKFVDILDQNGNVILAHQRARDVSFQSPGVPNQNTFEVWGRSWDQAGKVVLSGANDWERANAQAKAMLGKAPAAAQPSALTGVPQIEKAGAGQKAAIKEMDDEIKQLSADWSDYGKKTTLINNQEKEGMISLATATQEKLDLDKQISAEITNTIAKLQAQEAAVKKAYPTVDVTKYDDELKKLHDEQAQIQQDMQKLAGTDPWSSFSRGVQQAINSWGTFSTQMTTLGKQVTDELASGIGNGLTQLVEQTGKVSDAFKSMLEGMIKSIMDFLAKQAVQQLLNLATSAFGGSGSAVGGVFATIGQAIGGKATGGLVAGPSGPDQVPSMLTAGEYVLTNSAVDKYGIQMIEAMNRGTFQTGSMGPAPQKYASGGMVGAASSPANIPPSQGATQANTSQSLAVITNVTVPGAAGTSAGGTPIGSTNSSSQLSPQQLAQLQQSISLVIRDEIVRQKRPGGLLSKQQLSI